MPRIGDVYSPPYDPVVSGTPIESVEYNGTVADIAVDLNTPRPIMSGGTGADNVEEALFNLGGEKAAQLVTNYDSHVWLPGSFRSATTATGAPVDGHEFAGTCYLNEALAYPPANQEVVVEATDLADPANPDQYVRVKAAGVWGPWIQRNAVTSSANLGEYTFDNQVTFPPGSGQIRFNNATQNSTTEVFISHLSPAGVDNTAQLTFYLTSGVDLVVQDKDEGNKYKVFTTTAAAVLSGGDFRVTVVLKSAGTNLVSAQRVLVAVSGEAQRVQQRQLIYAAPFDALAYNGLQVNGGMVVSQENGTSGVSSITTSKYIVDGWFIQNGGTAVLSGQQNNNAPPGFSWSLAMYVTTANPSPAAGHFANFTHRIEGYRTIPLIWGTSAAQPITIGFWVSATRTGTFSGAVVNGASNRSYTFNFTVNAAGWEYKTVTIPGDTTGTWSRDNTAGIQLVISAMVGSTYATAPGAWTAGVFLGTPGSVNCVATTSDYMLVTGVVVLPGIEAPSAERSALIMRPYDQELATCQRYWQKITVSMRFYAAAVINYETSVLFPVEMRTAPTAALATTGFGVSNINGGVPSLLSITNKEIGRVAVMSAGVGDAYLLTQGIFLDARL